VKEKQALLFCEQKRSKKNFCDLSRAPWPLAHKGRHCEERSDEAIQLAFRPAQNNDHAAL